MSLKFALGAGVALAALTMAGTSLAGQADTRSASCGFNADGSGYCSGSLDAFRHSTDATARMVLQNYQSTSGISRYASVTFGGVNKFVPMSAGAPAALLQAFDQACNNVTANVYIHWNTSTQIDTIQLFNDSSLLP